MLFIQKYGGTSLADAGKIHSAARRAAVLSQQGHQVVLVVSAQGHTTDALLQQAASVNPHPSGRELDALMAVGEQISAALMAMALENLGCRAISLTGWQAGIETDGDHQNARITRIDIPKIQQTLDRGIIPVVAGFQGIGVDGSITTLGRGGSDTTAVALAAFLHADQCQIFTDVDGVYDRDPRVYPDAVRYEKISYRDMLALIEQGAQVLHDRSVEFAKEYGIRLEVLSACTGAPGTMVGPSESL